jgi:FAD binding domain
LDEATVQGFKSSVRGPLLRPRDAGYDAARKLYNGMIDRHPALIVRCAAVADVIATANFARPHDLLVAVRGGGHSVPGFSMCDGGVFVMSWKWGPAASGVAAAGAGHRCGPKRGERILLQLSVAQRPAGNRCLPKTSA